MIASSINGNRYNRYIEINFKINKTICLSNISNINLTMSDATVKAILLNNIQSNNILQFKTLQNRLQNAFLIFDEVDYISDPYRCELNYSDTNSKENADFLLILMPASFRIEVPWKPALRAPEGTKFIGEL